MVEINRLKQDKNRKYNCPVQLAVYSQTVEVYLTITSGNWKNWEKYAKLGNNKLGHERLKKLGNLKSLEKSEKLREIEEFCNYSFALGVLDCYMTHLQVLHH